MDGFESLSISAINEEEEGDNSLEQTVFAESELQNECSQASIDPDANPGRSFHLTVGWSLQVASTFTYRMTFLHLFGCPFPSFFSWMEKLWGHSSH